jgi:hypothetical protein
LGGCRDGFSTHSRIGLGRTHRWYEARALNIGPSASELASYRRAVTRLCEAGLLEKKTIDTAWPEPSTHPYYRVNRGLGMRSGRADGQGVRRRLVVRLPPTEDDREWAAKVRALVLEKLVAKTDRSYVNWYDADREAT